jgi:folate-dependent phosphoribosylglycinamide formyltransferase PurN
VQTKNIKRLEEEIHKLEHEVYPRVVEDIANGKIFLSQGKVIKK